MKTASSRGRKATTFSLVHTMEWSTEGDTRWTSTCGWLFLENEIHVKPRVVTCLFCLSKCMVHGPVSRML